ncbi:MAG: PTS glucose transporter subunit IIA [Olegusella sp.]|jgi:glucose-specific phosphotransferase system IIA component|nr:PTS glucose transporter subunit IIA [Olegusella sp.]
MGLFDKFKKAAKPAKPAAITVEAAPTAVYAPVPGTGVAMADLPDPVFASGAMGKAYGIVPTEGVVYAPVAGTITATTQTLHALGLASDDGIEVLIHVGVDTVNMKGDGFTGFVKQGDHVAAGEPLMTFDIAKIKKAGYATDVITVITNTDEFKSVEPAAPAEVAAGAKIFDVVPA